MTANVNKTNAEAQFQSTHPRRVWLAKGRVPFAHHIVSIHTPTKGVTLLAALNPAIKEFQSTHPRRVWPHFCAKNTFHWEFQSTHPRRVWLSQGYCRPLFRGVSIHTSTKGVTSTRLPSLISYACFNPHTHEGCDGKQVTHIDTNQQVSIHTPTKGVTQRKISTTAVSKFQSTHPRRVWQPFPNYEYQYKNVSIHTPTKGVTCGCNRTSDRTQVSIHTPTKGVTRYLLLLELRQQVSIHTPTKGVTKAFFFLVSFNLCFNPHTHEGCDYCKPVRPDRTSCFNPHTHEGCDLYNIRLSRPWDVSIHTPTKGVTHFVTLTFHYSP